MALDLHKLENVHVRGGKTIARCPACAEQGHDSGGEHLFIDSRGRFGCVVHPGAQGKDHRRRIFQLAKAPSTPGSFTIHPFANPPKPTIVSGVLGRLKSIQPAQPEKPATGGDSLTDSKMGVPSVPTFTDSENLGRLGRGKITHAYSEAVSVTKQNLRESDLGVPSVPKPEFLSELKIPVPSVPRPICPPSRYRPTTDEIQDAARLAAWLETAPLPPAFQLFPWVQVTDSGVYRKALLADLAGSPNHARFRPALAEAKRLIDLFSNNTPQPVTHKGETP